MKRRTFLQTASYFSVGALLVTKTDGCQTKEALGDIGLQLYSIKDAMQRDAAEALRKVATLGYKYVEGAMYKNGFVYGRSPQKFKAILQQHGLTMPSGYVEWVDLRDHAEQAIATARRLEQKYIVVPSIEEEMQTSKGYGELAEVLNTAGEFCQQYNIQLAYHNHDFEFNRMIAGQRPFDFLLSETEENLVKFELDFYWITRAGADYKKYIENHKNRFPLWHIKDMDATPEKYFAAAGDGVINWPEVFSYKEKAGMQLFFVAQDKTRPGLQIFDEIEKSYAYLNKMRY